MGKSLVPIVYAHFVSGDTSQRFLYTKYVLIIHLLNDYNKFSGFAKALSVNLVLSMSITSWLAKKEFCHTLETWNIFLIIIDEPSKSEKHMLLVPTCAITGIVTNGIDLFQAWSPERWWVCDSSILSQWPSCHLVVCSCPWAYDETRPSIMR